MDISNIFKTFCRTVGELYFRFDKLRNGSNQSLAGFEKIRTVGKGKFMYGTHVVTLISMYSSSIGVFKCL